MNYTDNSESLSSYEDFSRVYQNGKSFANRQLVLYVLQRDSFVREAYPEGKGPDGRHMPYSLRCVKEGDNRVGISVSKKVGNSVVRHHLCRLLRESYRLHDSEFVRGLDLAVIVRPGARECTFSEFERALLHLSRKAGILRGTSEGQKSPDETSL